MNSKPTAMRKLIIAGSHAQYRVWIAAHRANPRAAVEINRAEDLCGCDPEEDEIVLTGTYWDNPAYQSEIYLWLVNGRKIALAS